MSKKRVAWIVLGVLAFVLVLLVGRDWSTNAYPLWMDAGGFIAFVVLLGLINAVIAWAMNALTSKDDKR